MGRFWHHRPLRCIGWIVAYVLALQTMLFGLGAVPSLVAGSPGTFVQLCLGSADGDAGHPGSGPGTQHCLGCFAAAAELPPAPSDAAPLRYPTTFVVFDPVSPTHLASDAKGRPSLPRAPPTLA